MSNFNSKAKETYHNTKLFRQKCRCDSTYSERKYRTHFYVTDGVLKSVTKFYPIPSCDFCGTPWKEVHD